MSNPTSPFNMSNATKHTDTTIYPPPIESSTDEPDTKKRKLADGGVNGSVIAHTADNVTDGARFTNSMHANKHLEQVYAVLKKECEELADSIVSAWSSAKRQVTYMTVRRIK